MCPAMFSVMFNEQVTVTNPLSAETKQITLPLRKLGEPASKVIIYTIYYKSIYVHYMLYIVHLIAFSV
jgi:hypothetical protein